MRTKLLPTTCLVLLLACGESTPASSSDDDVSGDDDAVDGDDADDDAPGDGDAPEEDDSSDGDDGDGQRDAGEQRRDAGETTRGDGGGRRNDASTGEPRRDAGAPDAGSEPTPALDGGNGNDAATRDAAPSGSDAAGGDASVTPGGLFASLEGKTPYSTKPTGAATWLVNADARATQTTIDSDMKAAASSNKFAVFSLYRYQPNSGTDAAGHRAWVTAIAEAIARNPGTCVVVLEPDAFALGTRERPDVDTVLDTAVGILKEKAANAAVFLDIGHSNWIPAPMVLSRAKSYSNYAKIDGWATNTSNFQAMAAEVAFAKQLYEGSNKPAIIDTSRNGLGRQPSTIFNPPDSEWDPGPTFAFHPSDPAVLFNYYNKPSNERD